LGRVLPLIVCLALYWETGKEPFLAIGILSFFAILTFLTMTALVGTGSKNPGRLERIAR